MTGMRMVARIFLSIVAVAASGASAQTTTQAVRLVPAVSRPVWIRRPAAVATPTGTRIATATRTPTVTRTATLVPPTATPTASPTRTPTNTVRPTATRTPTAVDSGPLGISVGGVPPAQKLPAALLMYPLVRVASGTQDTRIEIVNHITGPVRLQCFYVQSSDCNEVGFFTSLTGNQPVSWMASTGLSGNGVRVAPPFSGDGELKCAVSSTSPDPSAHNAIMGRAIVSSTNGQTIGYTALAFRKIGYGAYSGQVSLDGVNYEQCPDRIHFNALASRSGSDSELILVPCSQDLVTQIPSTTTVQYAVVNEFEEVFSGSTSLYCMERRAFSTVAALRRSSTGTDQLHVVLRGVDVPVAGLVLDKFTPVGGSLSVSANEPYLEGGRSALVEVP
jgi:hypothetical protein